MTNSGEAKEARKFSVASDWAVHMAARSAPALLGFVAAAVIFYLSVILGLRTFPDGDFTHHFLPFSLLQQRELLAGRLPLWNAFTYSGHPFLADVQAAVFYPVSNLVLGLTLPVQSVAARLYLLQVEAIAQVALAGFFSYLLLRRLTGNGWAAWTGGALFAFSGYLTGYPPVQLAILRTAVWLPLIFWLLVRAFDAPRSYLRWVWVGAAVAIAFTAGHPQTFLYIVYATGAWTIALWVVKHRTVDRHPEPWWQPLAGLALALLAALGLSAAQLLPSLEFTRLSVRADVSYAYVSGGLPWRDTWQLLLPGVLTDYSPLYIGATGLGLATVAVAALIFPNTPQRSGRRNAHERQDESQSVDTTVGRYYPTLFFVGLALIALLLAYGDNGFLYPIFHRIAPGWNLFRGQERAAFLVAFGLSMLGGLGAAALPTLPLHLRKRAALLFGAGVTAWVYGFGLLEQLPGRTAVGQWHYLLITLITLALGMGFALAVWLPGWSNRRAIIISGLALFGLFWANAGTNATPFSPKRKTILAPEMAALAVATAETASANLGLNGRVYNEYRIYEDYGIRQKIEDVWGSSPLRLAPYAVLFEEFPLDRMWDLTGVEHVLTWRRELFEPSTLLGEFPQQEDTTYLHRLRNPNPRARLVTDVRPADDTTALALLADHTFDLTQTALVPPDEFPTLPPATADDAARIRLSAIAPGHLHIDVNSGGGLLLLSENWLPGWQVEHADRPGISPPIRTNLAFVGVAVPAGALGFDLVYRPASVRRGLWISGLTLILLAGAVVVDRAARRRGAGA